MTSRSESIWARGWFDRLGERLAEVGFGSFEELARASEGRPLGALVQDLGGDFAPMQVAVAMGTEARRTDWFGWFARDQLVRAVRGRCGLGWSALETTDFDRAHALATWAALMKDFQDVDAERVDDAARAVLANAPQGWDPQGVGDWTIRSFVVPSDWS